MLFYQFPWKLAVKLIAFVFCLCVSLFGQQSRPVRLFSDSAALTAPSGMPPGTVAQDHLRSVASQIGLGPDDIAGAYLAKEYRTAHNGVTHLVYKQRFEGIDVYNAEWVVNVDRQGRVLNAGGELFARPGAGVVPAAAATGLSAVRAAVEAVNPQAAERYVPFSTGETDSKTLRFHRGALGSDVTGERIWYAVKGVLRPAWLFYVLDEDRVSGYATVVDSGSSRVLKKEARTYFQSARGLVFERSSPQPNPLPGVRLTAPATLVSRTLQLFTGDPVASPQGWTANGETAGNNAIAGLNPAAFSCISGLNCLFRPQTAKAVNGEFSFPLELGPDSPNPTAFADAATVNLFYWVNRAHDMFYHLGFDEAAGNFQVDNFGRGGSGGDPVYAYSQYGTSGDDAPQLNNAFFASFGTGNDGSPSLMGIFLNTTRPNDQGRYFTDGSFDAETIIHEYGHGVSTRLVRGLSTNFHGRSMGEGWSDFWALELLLPDGAPVDGAYPFSEYPGQDWGVGIRTRPYSTNLAINPLTFAHFGRVLFLPEVHADGEIWAQALWEARANLIRQFGETEGRRRIRLLVIDAMKLTLPAPSMLDMRDAILLADRVDFDGASQAELWKAFAKRGMGVLAQAGSGSSVHVTPSFETPADTGALRFYEDHYTIGEVVRIVLHDGNATASTVMVQLTGSSGDRENVTLQKTGAVYLGRIETSYGPVFRNNNSLDLIPGDSISAYYFDARAAAGSQLVQHTVETTPDYSMRLLANGLRVNGRETALNLRRAPFASQLRALPFEFPYFGRKYSSIWVYNNGLLAFDLPDFAPCTDAYSLSLNNAIAPMYMDLRTDGSAQQAEDVYQSQETPDSVTFRWAAETSPDFSGSTPEPVNFAVTLYQDGRIRFQYGAGNQNLVAGSQFFGCNTATPTVGLSNGHETFVQLSPLHDGKPKLENAYGLLFEPGFSPRGGIVGELTTPEPDARAKGSLVGGGTVSEVDGEVGVRRLDVLVDGIAMEPAQVFPSRAGQPAEFAFSLAPSLLGLAPGAHTLQIRATNTRGVISHFPETPQTFYIEPGDTAPRGRIETPEAGAEVSGTVRLRGFVYAPDIFLSQVDVLVDGINVGRASYGEPRRDVCGGLDPAPLNCPYAGFSFSLNTARSDLPLTNGPHTISLRVMDEAGAYSILPETVGIIVNNPVPQRPKGLLTSPAHNQTVSGAMKIWGLAWAPEGRITGVSLYIDGYNYGDIPYGETRQDQCEALGTPRGCPNIGFEMDFDTRRLSNGVHSLGILVRDDQGRTEFFPGEISFGINISVANER